LASAAACGGDDAPARAPSGGGKGGRGGGGVMTPPRPMDGGNEPDEDGGGGAGGSTGMVLKSECIDFDPAPYGETMVGDLNNAIGKPADFVVTRAVATWDDGCDRPTILIVLSDGMCPRGDGHELTFFLDAQGIEDGTIIRGMNNILPEDGDSGGVRVRYNRPMDLEPAGSWGSCTGADGSFGVVAKDGDLDANDLANIQARFELTLTACDGMADGVQNVLGSFNIDMRRSLDDVCN
jgi:hypothetical protein